MRHKSLVASFLSLLLALSVVLGNMVLPSSESELSTEAIQNMSAMLLEQTKRIYIPAYWFGDAAIHGNMLSLLLLIAVSALIFVAMVAVLQRCFMSVCSALNATSAKNNYKMKQLKTNSVVTALWKRELKRYFASSLYVTNTLIGYILMAAFGISLLFVSTDQLETLLGMPHIIAKIFPLAIAVVGNLMPTTSSAISMEGKQWWIAQTLPIRMKDLILSKILVNLTIAAPFYLIGTIAGCIALKPDVTGCIWIFVIPAVYTVFCSVLGITMNLSMPVFKWDNEARVIKQSAAGMLTMLISVLTLIPAIVLILVLTNVSASLILLITTLILLVVAGVLYQRNSKRKIIEIGN